MQAVERKYQNIIENYNNLLQVYVLQKENLEENIEDLKEEIGNLKFILKEKEAELLQLQKLNGKKGEEKHIQVGDYLITVKIINKEEIKF